MHPHARRDQAVIPPQARITGGAQMSQGEVEPGMPKPRHMP